jgi:hypothetical protein
MEINCLAVSFCVEIYASGVGFGYGFNLLCPCSWCFKFFSSWSSGSVPQRGVCWVCYPCRFLVVVAIASFLPSVRGLEVLVFMGMQRPSSSCGEAGSLCIVGVGLLAPAGWCIATWWRTWESSSWTREMWLQGGGVKRWASGALRGHFVILPLWLVSKGPLALRARGECWPFVLCSSWQQISKA